MNSGIRTSVVITNLLNIALVLQVIAVVITQQKLEANIENANFHIGVLVGYISNILFFMSGSLAFFTEGKWLPKYVKSAYLLLLCWVVLVYFRTGGSLLDPGSFMEVKGVAPYLGMSVLFAAKAPRFLKIMKFLLWIGLALAIGGIINTLKLGGGFDRMTAQMQLRLIAVNLVWISPLILFFNYKKYKILSLSIFGLSFLFSLLIVTRSFLLIHVLVFLFFMRVVLKKKIGCLILGLLVVFIGVIYLAPQIGAIEHAINLLNERGNDDTRSTQILLFLADISFYDFIWGAGINSTWNYASIGEYGWLDNQVLLTAWWAGVVPICIYLMLFIKPMYTFLFKKKVNPQIKAVAFMLFLWILALLGFGVYVSISTSLYHFVLCFSMGFLLHVIKLKMRFKNAI
ncbi:hypothetical protein [Kriegella aquimaris]|uniref:O-antigen ligase like membrane protein n=1 Tax=Kriegella aquimaris TaxID=192904 RepID=A0A1G9U6V1_9FLAO|nr:hypothetical protein [Kriegella aquimaris]SDM55553.1 hypothetical protein SAMN04488514_110140 [Kriegella aquimaris]